MLVNAGLLALWAVLPGLLLGYVRQSLAARRIRPEFSLRKSEASELDRAVLLYEKVYRRLKEINDQSKAPESLWRVLCRRGNNHRHGTDELEDLEAYAHHLRVTIIRLKRRPLERLRSLVHAISTQFALGRALAAHVIGLGLLIVGLHEPQQLAWAKDLTSSQTSPLVWYPFDARFFYANAVAAGIAAVAGPAFYFVRTARLRQQFELEFCEFEELADIDPDQIIIQQEAEQADHDSPQQQQVSSELGGEDSWFTVLGVSQSATIEEVKEAYKALIKQNHPDRVHNMSPVFSKLAETETKKINAAYQQALISVTAIECGA